ncbi:hypothetical protein Cflav_PD5595 [Pedosphaera parvula Ellin514]|uniref:Uncharacterized protein n=2 Tax=Pedosphaera TaxID=1032526 RepID=B9XBS5_PEDPL|nr:hypothetical protein Cflav_PD5595 [Pedosphaera parvula Ellin514]
MVDDLNYVLRTYVSKLLLTGAVCFTVAVLVSGCRKSERESAERAAIARHQQEVQRQKEFRKVLQGPEAARINKSVEFLALLHHNGQLPGIAKHDHGMLRLEKPPLVSPNGPYYWSLQLHVITKDSPPRNYFYVLVQTYSNSDFQLQKAWRADASGKVVETYPIKLTPTMAKAHMAFLGPANPGAENGFAGWYTGVLGGGTVVIDNADPATGLNSFRIGITNAAAHETNHADIRSEMFPLERARGPFTFAFAYKLPGKVNPGDNIDVAFRFFGREGDFLGQTVLHVGSSTDDSEMLKYKTMTATNLFPPKGVVQADVWIVANIGDPWTSGYAHFDNFSVTVVPARSRAGIFAGMGIFAALTAWLIGTHRVRHRRKRRNRYPSPFNYPQVLLPTKSPTGCH